MDDISIGAFAQATGLTPKALRLYDELGLLAPAAVDSQTGYRRYADDQLEQARLVAALRRVGMPLARIRTAIGLPPALAAAELRSFWRQTEADVRSRRVAVDALITELRSRERTMSTKHTPEIRAGHATGRGTRPRMQDAAYVGSTLWALADGFHNDDGKGADVAPRLLDALAAEDGSIGAERIDEILTDVAASLPAGSPIGTTLTAITVSGDVATVIHVGDSRAFLLRDGVLRQVTTDHTEIAALVDEGRLTEEEARLHPRRAILNRAIAAGAPADPDVTGWTMLAGDRIVLTTDGVHALLEADAFADMLDGEPQEAADRVAAAVIAQGAPDDYGVIVLAVGV